MSEIIYEAAFDIPMPYNHDYKFIVDVRQLQGQERYACLQAAKHFNGKGQPYSGISLRFAELTVDDCETMAALFTEAADVIRRGEEAAIEIAGRA